jgi:hypothetical protein
MHHAIDLALDEELRTIALETRRGSMAVHAIVAEVRERLRLETGLQDRMAQGLERLIIDKAAALPSDGGIVIDVAFDGRGLQRPGANPG